LLDQLRKRKNNYSKYISISTSMNYLLTGAETDRLRFRLLNPDDFNDWLPLFKEKNVAVFLGMDADLTPHQMCEKWFEKSFARYEKNRGGMNVLEDKQTGELIGQSGILVQNVEDEDRIEIGYSVLPKFWNKGYASEGSRKCLNHAFEQQIATSIISIVHIDNIGSASVAIKNGMSIEKNIKSYQGSPVNIYSIAKEAWQQL
jgi:ribosomal-protein-alanine N-acetyltransferase